ncbi:MFS transporter [Brevibacillus centrosporus]|uniref:MFS transporter n=1 Tax=Brevibacillus centrosporus TaxID=54910 RepID=UPI000F0A688A|nr:MFS transporter [Brevibacillus centrosporus]MEC2129766.1 MFS transporter [Brevibacillus centrosporus]RNB67172.1 MFS transporter [Brevibacillus centrosporus]GED32878.1 tetracycline efflux MFS transporter TetA(P) [Brevibacillus centrosporus]
MKMNATKLYMLMRFTTALANSTMFTTYAIFYVATLGLSPLELLVVGTVLELTVVLFEGVTGVVADTYSRRLSMIIGMFVLGSGFVLQGVMGSLAGAPPLLPMFGWVLLAQVLFGVGHTFISGADTAWIADEAGEEQLGSLFMRAKRVSLVATMAGIGLSVYLSTQGAQLPYFVGGLMYMALGLLLILFMKETGFMPRMREAGSTAWQEMKTTWLTGVQVVRAQPILLLILIVTLFSGASSEGYDRLREAHLIREIGFPAAIPLSMAVWFGVMAVATAFLGLIAVKLTEKWLDINNERIVMTGMFMLTFLRLLAILFFALSPSFWWALAALLLIGLIEAISSPLYDTWLNMNIPSNVRATVLSMLSQSNALGQTAGGPAVGWVGSRISVRASLIVAAVLLSPILYVYGKAVRRS